MTIREHTVDPMTGLKVTKTYTINGELGTGFYYPSGAEIFEGDIIDGERVELKKGAFRVGGKLLSSKGYDYEN